MTDWLERVEWVRMIHRTRDPSAIRGKFPVLGRADSGFRPPRPTGIRPMLSRVIATGIDERRKRRVSHGRHIDLEWRELHLMRRAFVVVALGTVVSADANDSS